MALTNDDLQAIANLMNQAIQPINSRLEKIESEVSALKAGQVEIRKEIRQVDKRVSDTYNLALDAWGTSTENRNWLQTLDPQ